MKAEISFKYNGVEFPVKSANLCLGTSKFNEDNRGIYKLRKPEATLTLTLSDQQRMRMIELISEMCERETNDDK